MTLGLALTQPHANTVHCTRTAIPSIYQLPSMYGAQQLAYAPTPYVPRSALSATINLDEV